VKLTLTKTQEEFKMAKIDVTKIEGYEGMTPEERLAALEAYEYEDNAEELTRYKNAAAKANSEAAEWKKKHNQLLSEEERKKQEENEEISAMKAELEALKKEKTVALYKANLIGQGYNEELASDTAAAMAEGDMDRFFANQKEFIRTHDRAFKAEILKNTPAPPAGEGTCRITKEKFRQMTLPEKQELASKEPELYKQITTEE